MSPDEVHAKLVRALQMVEMTAEAAVPSGTRGLSRETLAELVQPLALASIALELREIRQALKPVSVPR